jgi:hypothetical protein
MPRRSSCFCFCNRALAALWIVLIGSMAVANSQPPSSAPSDDENLLLAPFISSTLIESIVEDLERQRIEEERVSGIYLDPHTGLLWTTEDNGRDIDWHRARSYCRRLVLAGYDDWTLPSIEDLEALLRPMAKGTYNLPEKFLLTACCPWSSTTKSEQSAWNFNFQFSKPFSGAFSYTYDHRALCMRRPQEEERLLIENLLKAARQK